MRRLLLFSLLLGGCANAPFNPPEFNKRVIVDTTIDDNIGYTEEGVRIVGQFKRIDGVCYIKVPTITWLYDEYNMCVWGHEFMHCVYDYYHKGAVSTCTR